MDLRTIPCVAGTFAVADAVVALVLDTLVDIAVAVDTCLRAFAA